MSEYMLIIPSAVVLILLGCVCAMALMVRSHTTKEVARSKKLLASMRDVGGKP